MIPSTVRPVVVSGSRARGSGDQGDQDEDRNRTRSAASSTTVSVSRTRGTVAPTTSSTDPAVELIDDDPMSLERGRAEQRRASKEVVDEFQTGRKRNGSVSETVRWITWKWRML